MGIPFYIFSKYLLLVLRKIIRFESAAWLDKRWEILQTMTEISKKNVLNGKTLVSNLVSENGTKHLRAHYFHLVWHLKIENMLSNKLTKNPMKHEWKCAQMNPLTFSWNDIQEKNNVVFIKWNFHGSI